MKSLCSVRTSFALSALLTSLRGRRSGTAPGASASLQSEERRRPVIQASLFGRQNLNTKPADGTAECVNLSVLMLLSWKSGVL